MSTKYQKWTDGELAGDAKMEAQFDELKGLGFNFDIKPCYGSTRSWDDHYEKLKEFKEQNGNVRVPLKWKADLRLGKWVQLQRKAKRTRKISDEHREFYVLYCCFVACESLLISSVIAMPRLSL